MLQVHGVVAQEEDAQLSLRLGEGRLHDYLILLPLVAAHGHLVGEEVLTLAVGHGDGQLHAYAGILVAFGYAAIEGEAVLLVLLHTDAEETLVEQCCPFVSVSRAAEAHVVGVALEGTVVAHLYVACHLPSGEGIGEVKRAVLHQLGIQATVGSVVDVLDEEAIHGLLDGRAIAFHVDGELMVLSVGRESERRSGQ